MKEELATKNDLEMSKNHLEKYIDTTRKELQTTIETTKKDLETTIAETKKDLETTIAETKKDLETTIAETKKDLETTIAETKKELKSDIAKTKNELEKRIDIVEWKTDQIDGKLSIFRDETGQTLNTIINSLDGLAKLITDGQTERAAVHSLCTDMKTRSRIMKSDSVFWKKKNDAQSLS